ncbi:hypothetical protein HAX54_033113 [Datura stramonium]|uniref:Uncharacterized protein n=1 Tax=Datura stramonium TaxID=4076 RepID=A0ABS8VCU8_DATST|nr:hypothetical protein [Datura stramonium]
MRMALTQWITGTNSSLSNSSLIVRNIFKYVENPDILLMGLVDGTPNNPNKWGSENMDLDHIHMESSPCQRLNTHRSYLHHVLSYLLDPNSIDVEGNILHNTLGDCIGHSVTVNSKSTHDLSSQLQNADNHLLHNTRQRKGKRMYISKKTKLLELDKAYVVVPNNSAIIFDVIQINSQYRVV